MGPTGYHETSVRNYHYSLRKNPEERSSRLLSGGSLISRKFDLNLQKKLLQCYIWSIASCGAETRTLRIADQMYLKVLKSGAAEGCGRSFEPIVRKMKYDVKLRRKGIS